MGRYAISPFRSKRGQHSAVSHSHLHGKQAFLDVLQGAWKSNFREGVKCFQPAGTRGDSLTRKQTQSVDPIWDPPFHGADVRDALFKHKNFLCWKNTQILDSSPPDKDESTGKKLLLRGQWFFYHWIAIEPGWRRLVLFISSHLW